MYSIIRRIHLYAGLTLLTWIVMYFFTGLPFLYENWFGKNEPVITMINEAYSSSSEPSDPQFWLDVENHFSIRGKRGKPEQKKDGMWQMKWSRPGAEYLAVVSPDTKEAVITKTVRGMRSVLIGLHRIHGYGGGWLYNIYAFFLDLSSLAVILFSVSGIYLWYKSARNKIPGIICLILGFGFTAAMITHLMTHP